MPGNLSKSKKFDARARLDLVLQVIKKDKPVSRVCKRARVSRSFFYKLKKQYLQAGESRKAKLNALEPKREWIRRGKQLSRNQIKQILLVVLKNPEYGITRILRQIYAKNQKKIVSHGGIQTFLFKLDLNTSRKRKSFTRWARQLPSGQIIDLALLALRRYQAKDQLSPEERLKAIRLTDAGAPVVYICRLFQIERKNFYKWQKLYNQSLPGKEYQAVTNKKPIIERYWRQATDEQVEAILKIVIEHPEYSTHKIAEILPWIGNHGVQNVFRRQNLNTFEKRLAYAQAQAPLVTPVVGLPARVRRIIGKIPVISAIPPPKAEVFRRARQKFYYLAGQAGPPFFFSLLSSIILFNLFVFWLRIISQAPTLVTKLGLVFTSVALLVGGFFFAYSMKYYLTLALVLSFSRQPLEEGGGYVFGLNGRLNNNHQKNNNHVNWLARIFGLRPYGPIGPEGLGDGDGERREVVQAGGLQPSLDHIKLKRYPFVSIHLPFYNERKVAERILKACTSMDYPNLPDGKAGFEIVVVDDSTDKTTKIVQRYAKKYNKKHPQGPKIKVLHRPTRQGFKGGALAYALKHTHPKAEFVVVLDADFIPYPDTLELFIKYFKANNNNSENYTKSNIAVVGGYQWHVLNKSENWITRGVRCEYAGSYVIERPGREILGLIKQISGSVYMIRADLLKQIGWGTSITEDFQLTLKLYEQGYKVIYTPYVQAPAECASTLGRLVRQRMRWAEGHSSNIRKMFFRLIFSPKLTLMEKLEVFYLSPFYLQAFFFLVGTLSWILAETAFRARLPFWTSLWGWSLVLTNFFSLPLMNAVGLFLEESEEKDYLGLISFIALSYILVPFQAYASVKGFIEKEEGPWFRTPKTGKITDIFTRGRFYRWITGILPGRRPAPAIATQGLSRLNPKPYTLNPYLALATANNQFNSFQIKPKRPCLAGRQVRWVSKAALVCLLIVAITIFSSAQRVVFASDPPDPQGPFYLDAVDAQLLSTTEWELIDNDSSGLTDDSNTRVNAHNKNVSVGWYQYPPGNTNVYDPEAGTGCDSISPDGRGWIFPTPFGSDGYIDSGSWSFRFDETDDRTDHTGHLDVCVWRIIISGESIQDWDIIYDSNADGSWDTTTDIWNGGNDNDTRTTGNVAKEDFGSLGSSEYLYVEYFNHITVVGGTGGPSDYYSTFRVGGPDPNFPNIDPPTMKIPEKVVFLLAATPFIPMVVLWMRKKQGLGFRVQGIGGRYA